MHSRTLFCVAIAMLPAIPSAVSAQTFSSIPAIPFDTSGLVLRSHAEPQKPFTVAGERGVLLGRQDGTFEAWVLPVKLLSHLTIEARIEGYTVPIDVNQQAAQIEVRPDRTTITYSHIGFTVRQIMFSPDEAPAGTGPVALFEFDCLHPTDFTVRFTPELRWMWPERNEGVPGVEWAAGAQSAGTSTVGGAISGREADGSGPATEAPSGYYVLHSDYPDLAAAVTIPGARPGILAPYQERPQVHPVELNLHIDPKRDRGRLFPLLMAIGTTPAAAASAALGATLAQLNQTIAAGYQAHADRYKSLLASSTSIETPDKTLDEAFQWAVVSIEQLRARASPTGETALVAGYYASGDSARPGFGWFFGRDALYTLFAVHGFGDFTLSKSELEFLIHRQRADGKIMHEYSQTAAAPGVDWQSFPYMYAAADATPLFLLAVEDYVRSSGDLAFLSAHRDAVERAWAFETDPDHDTDHDGIYDNSQGTGWVESWPSGMPHQEIYLALLDQQASTAMAGIETLLKDQAKAFAAQKRAETISKTIESEYYDKEKSCYAFSRNADGSQDRTATVYPALAWWASPAAPLAHAGECLTQFAGHTLNTDWGLRDVANDQKIYDGMSYHQGSVWPLFTGWAALAEYRGGQPLAGYRMLMENANLTRDQDLGAVTELLSGDFFVPFGRSTSHQLWSSAMVITPTLRGLFGITIDAQTRTISVDPHLPASWGRAVIRNIHVGDETVDLSFVQSGTEVSVRMDAPGGAASKPGLKLISGRRDAKPGPDGRISLPRPPVEIEPVIAVPEPGARERSVRIVAESDSDRKLTLTLEGLAGTQAQIPVFLHTPKAFLRAEGAVLSPSELRGSPQAGVADQTAANQAAANQAATVSFPAGEGWKTITVTLTW